MQLPEALDSARAVAVTCHLHIPPNTMQQEVLLKMLHERFATTAWPWKSCSASVRKWEGTVDHHVDVPLLALDSLLLVQPQDMRLQLIDALRHEAHLVQHELLSIHAGGCLRL